MKPINNRLEILDIICTVIVGFTLLTGFVIAMTLNKTDDTLKLVNAILLGIGPLFVLTTMLLRYMYKVSGDLNKFLHILIGKIFMIKLIVVLLLVVFGVVFQLPIKLYIFILLGAFIVTHHIEAYFAYTLFLEGNIKK